MMATNLLYMLIAIYAHFIIIRYSSFLLLVPCRYIRYVLFLYYNYIPFLFLFFSFFLYPGGTGSLIWQLEIVQFSAYVLTEERTRLY